MIASHRPSLAQRWLRAALDLGERRHVIAIAVLCLNAWLLAHFHDRFWWPPDEGNYAHVAERVLDGQVLHADVQDIHPGYVNLANAGALALFGRELSSMRYPLALLGVAQSLIIFLILRPTGVVAAGVGATAITALGFLQFLNPTAHWYCLFLIILLAGVLDAAPREARWRLDVVGAIVMTTVLFRQLSGILVAMGALTWLLIEQSPDTASTDSAGSRSRSDSSSRPWLARGLIAVMIAGLVAYLARSTDHVGWVLFGIWPVLVLTWAGLATRVPNGRVVAMLAHLGRGGLVAALPLVAYHLAHGSLGPWYQDALVTALRFPRLPFFDRMSYADHLAEALRSIASLSVQGIINGAFWSLMMVLGVIVGARLLGQLRHWRLRGAPNIPPALPVLAVFYGVVSVHYQIPIYVTYTAGLSFAALIHLRRGSRLVTCLGVALIATAIVWHAGQPLSRGIAGASAGQRIALVASDSVPKVGLRIEPSDVELYGALVALIHREVPPEASILAIPSHAELYFLSGRRNPFRFFNTALGVTTSGELDAVLTMLEREPPVLVFYDRRDKYNTTDSHAIMSRVAATYERLGILGSFEIYRRSEPEPSVAVRTPAQSSKE